MCPVSRRYFGFTAGQPGPLPIRPCRSVHAQCSWTPRSTTCLWKARSVMRPAVGARLHISSQTHPSLRGKEWPSPGCRVMSAPPSAPGDQSCYVSDHAGPMIIAATRPRGHRMCSRGVQRSSFILYGGWFSVGQLEPQCSVCLHYLPEQRSSASAAFLPQPVTDHSPHLPEETPSSLF